MREQHPDPQWVRNKWRSLNGEWEFDFDFSKTAREKELYKNGNLSKKINIPFCPESSLSGISYTDFINSVCYKKDFDISYSEISKNIFLHFGAVDFHSYIYINGQFAGEHIGGYSSFAVNITSFVNIGKNSIFVIAEDDVRSMYQPAGKQSSKYNSYGCFYTRTTGIWQTVWLEFVPKQYIEKCKFYPDIENKRLIIEGTVRGCGELEILSSYHGRPTGKTKINVNTGMFSAQIDLTDLYLWEIGCGRLYDLELKFEEDTVYSYFGMRKVSIDGLKFKLNNKCVFLRMVLDQGYYPDGIYTAKTDADFEKDIKIAKDFGFNGARLHQKVFDKRFLYHCDKEGYMVWGEHANWGMDYNSNISFGNFLNEWIEVLERDFNNPSIIGWCPINETWHYYEKSCESRFIETVYNVTKLYDKTRPCIDVSGNYHLEHKEIHDVHDYEQDIEKFYENYSKIDKGIVNDPIRHKENDVQPYYGEPIFVSEYGGIKWAPREKDGWGYGNAADSVRDFVQRYKGLTETLLKNKYIMGLCYTQLYDVEQEQNGLYYYNRDCKFDNDTIKQLKDVMTQKATIEE